MHFTHFWAIAERDHTFQNPTSAEKLMLLADYCRMRDGLRVLDVGCGKGWLLRTWAGHWAIEGVGLELNPHFVQIARQQASVERVDGRLTFVEGPALSVTPQPQSFDVVLCIGASFALGGFEPALDWMRRALRPGGFLAIGEPFLNDPPPPDVRALWGEEVDAIPVLHDIGQTVAARDMQLSGMIAASLDDWDRYESLKWRAVYDWARDNPLHPDRAEVLEAIAGHRERYLRYERRYLGWAIFVAT